MHYLILRMGFGNLLRLLARLPAAAIAALVFLNVGAACGSPLLPNTKIRLTLVQWMPTKGSYEQWATVGGEYTVSDAGTISIPLLGPVSVGNMDETTLASTIAKQLKEKIGLVDEPAATIEILKYPPIYVVGDVTNPGEYAFHTDITVLQAFAMGGGQMRASAGSQNSVDTTKLVGDLKEIDDSIIRSTARIERLEAEMAGEKSLKSRQEGANANPLTAAIYKQEEAIFSARANELTRQSKSLSGLRDLLSEEINVLQEKVKSTDANIGSVQQQLDSTIALIEKGAIVATRQADVERVMRGYQNDRLDLTVAIMRARQSISQTTRDLEGLYDRRQTEVASELQVERATIGQLLLKRDTSQKLLMDSLSSSSAARPDEDPKLAFSIVRNLAGKSNEIDASETTTMMPGDVLKVTLRPGSQTSASNSLKAAETTARNISQ
ncbi:polysaccharide biosynthesis/export family protein [Rhizobium sp. BK060]|uniref:polysaccharide biosynthesis/export family protein n=1 Tax=Rhizobium sp. BK060 TaxID=2587096 RepID=UPI001622B58F|nr:polysaccharide biosynthesis/export family protein [Rhizobium sp. BK060]MBB3396470.1 polysaccharide export outer membrane protein [Rhizobium sp. BK060]